MWYALVAPALAQAPPPLSPDARFALALFCNPTCSEDVVDTLDAGLSSITARAGFPDTASKPMRIMGIAGEEFGIPDAAFVELYGDGVDRPEELAKSQEVLLAWIAGPRESAGETFATAHAAFLAAAKKGGGWVEDLDTQRLYGADAWAATDPRGPITDWFVVDAEPQDQGATEPVEGAPLRLVTRGLRRYGDFELVVENVPEESAGDVSFVVNAIAEALRKRANVPFDMAIDTPGVRGKASFRTIARRESDPEDPLLRATFEGEITLPASEATPVVPALPMAPTTAAPPVAVADASTTTGAGGPDRRTDATSPTAIPAATSPTATSPAATSPNAIPAAGRPAAPPVPAGPPAGTLEEAQRLARERFATVVRPLLGPGLPPGDTVAVKAPFRTPSGAAEYMWVEVRAVTGDELVGVLLNEPYDVPALKKGDPVTLRQTDIFDYLWKKADGSREGNTTAAFLQ